MDSKLHSKLENGNGLKISQSKGLFNQIPQKHISLHYDQENDSKLLNQMQIEQDHKQSYQQDDRWNEHLDQDLAAKNFKINVSASHIQSKYKVFFPYQIFQPQIKYITEVIASLENKKYAILESPTGSGKTLCLFSGLLPWIIKSKLEGKPMKAIFLTRTHSQIKQVVSEIQQLPFKIKTSILSSRKNMCVNEEVQLGSKNLDNQCKQLIRNEQKEGSNHSCACNFYQNFNLNQDMKYLRFVIFPLSMALNNLNFSRLISPCWSQILLINYQILLAHIIKNQYDSNCLDIEELVVQGSNNLFCPYFYSRETYQEADVILMPFIFLTNNSIFTTLNLNLTQYVLIFDESHNLPNEFQEQSTRLIEHSHIEKTIKLISKLQYLEKSSQSGEEELLFPSSQKNQQVELESLLMLFQILSDKIKSVDFKKLYNTLDQDSPESSKKFCQFITDSREKQVTGIVTDFKFGMQILQQLTSSGNSQNSFLFQEGICQFNIAELIQSFDFFTLNFQNKSRDYTSSIRNFLISIHEIFLISEFDQEKNSQTYQVSFTLTEKQKFGGDSIGGFQIELLCLNPANAFQKVLKNQPYSIILTSGTFGDLQLFENQLETKFPIKLRNDPIFNPFNSLVCGILDQNQQNQVLDFSYKSSLKKQIYFDLASVLIQTIGLVPNGVVVFFSSKQKLKDFFLEIENSPGIREEIELQKQIFIDEGSATSKIMIENYFKEAESQTGAILFSVARGSFSEGIDFKDFRARAVIMVGIPYLNLKEPKVVAKMSIPPNGQKWYQNQAFLAVNQAIGRVIRHKEDFGAILFFDSRFQNYTNLLPKYITEQYSENQSLLKLWPSIQFLSNDIKQFFKKKNNKSFTNQKF